MFIRVLVLLTGLMATVHDQALAATAPMAVDPREQLFEPKKAAIPEPTAGAPIGAKPGLPKPPEGSMAGGGVDGQPVMGDPAQPVDCLPASGRCSRRPDFRRRLRRSPNCPHTPTAPPPKPVEPEKPQLLLLGTVAGREKMRLVHRTWPARPVLRLKAGENHKGWILRAVSRRQVELARGPDITVIGPARRPT